MRGGEQVIISRRFDPDRNSVLQNLQSKLYWELLYWLYACPRQRYLNAVQLVNTDTELAVLVRRCEGFDHHLLESAHDKIAAHYRYAVDNGGQITLPFHGLTYEARLERDWRTYWRTEVAKLTERDDEFVLAVLEVVAYRGTATGDEASHFLMGRLNAIYGVDWDFDFCAPIRHVIRRVT